MEFAQLSELVERLIERTKSKTAIWNRGSGSDSYQIIIGSRSITIDRFIENFGNEERFVLKIFNESGEVIDAFGVSNSGDPAEMILYHLLKKLHEEARRCFYKIDEAMSSFIEELKKPGTIGKQIDPPKQEKKSDDLPF